MSPERAEWEHQQMHPLSGSACTCLCGECYNPNWPTEMKNTAGLPVLICLCLECGCGGSH